ncbi:alcohol dehydrogenase catalytic domain-containing protein [Cryptosporangium arvum]|uniref:alcohol dehydrogenase catalytic domain-containing protein n=1 Tax=Cryptosporangium arvum TaxID=80871 RepID=UPI0004AE0251|nr:alcohol dehydrogenase catalytic domain-containing protein [Cryptosporangium arvum]
MRTVQVAVAGGSFGVVEQEPPEPGRGQVRVTVEACGVCRTDQAFVDGGYPVSFPLVPGHEIAGRIDVVGADVEDWVPGDRVAVGWFGGHCGRCTACRGGDFIHCARIRVPGWAYPGGYADALVVPVSALARIPDGISAVEAAPMGCAGVATFNGLRHSAARPGDLVAVLGLGGLGHLGVQFAARMGFETVAISRGAANAEPAARFGAHHYVDSTTADVAAELTRLGGAAVVLSTVNNSDAMGATVAGLRPRGELVVVGVDPEPIRVSPFQLVPVSRTVHGHPSGTARDVEETLRFARLTGVRPVTETLPLEQAGAAYARMTAGRARYRMVLTTGR